MVDFTITKKHVAVNSIEALNDMIIEDKVFMTSIFLHCHLLLLTLKLTFVV